MPFLMPDDFLEIFNRSMEGRPKTTVGARECATCRRMGIVKQHAVLITMAPGHDGVAWFLCARHWSDGAKTVDTVKAERQEATTP